MDNLKSVVLQNNPDFEGNTKNSLQIIKETLDNALAEKDRLKEVIDQVRDRVYVWMSVCVYVSVLLILITKYDISDIFPPKLTFSLLYNSIA